MEWVQEFYTKQNAWGEEFYLVEVDESHRKRAAYMETIAGDGAKHMLELGAGGGQTSAALADLGHTVTAVELVPAAVAHAQQLADQPRKGAMTVIDGDFYQIDLPAASFDVICYWDGFGVGTDADQRRLLSRISHWLKPQGCAIIEVGTPWFWAYAAGNGRQVGQAMRRYGFDAEGCRLLDTWWPIDDESQAITQSIRCYSPADFRLLLQGTGLHLASLEPTGAVNYEAKTYREQAPLAEAMGYMTKLIQESTHDKPN